MGNRSGNRFDNRMFIAHLSSCVLASDIFDVLAVIERNQS